MVEHGTTVNRLLLDFLDRAVAAERASRARALTVGRLAGAAQHTTAVTR